MDKQKTAAHDSMESRKRDPYLDRRSGEDRREVYLLDYFFSDNPDRRTYLERRSKIERRSGCIRVDDWSSVCPPPEEPDEDHPFVRYRR